MGREGKRPLGVCPWAVTARGRRLDGGIWWHGWVAYDGATWNRYDDLFDFGPVPTLAHRRQYSKVAVLTDRIWVSEPANPYHPHRNDDIEGPPIGANHRKPTNESGGGNIGFIDGHIQFRYVEVLPERVDAYTSYRLMVCY